MEIGLTGRYIPEPVLPAGYRFLPWSPTLLERHAEAKYRSFRAEIDANVFPCLGEYAGCLRLMEEIARKQGFLPEATWLIAKGETLTAKGEAGKVSTGTTGGIEYCGTIQGIRDSRGVGAVQNLGVTPEHRGLGLGACLLLKALRGFQAEDLPRAFLEVTAQNEAAIRLYEEMGFRRARTVYKAVEVAYT
ncbi:MAG: GNAT family N-acetyltransferase [Planctomycetales bacterium]|nr:GNAT family N-acetyltransferase [Planctomycetales bacterium]